MPSESTQAVRRQFAAFADDGLDAMAAFWHPEALSGAG